MFRTVGDQPSLWEAILPEELRRLPEELARVDALLDDPVFFAPFVPFFDPRIGRPSTPMETYLRLMFLKFRYRLGYESLCREVSATRSPGGGSAGSALDGSVPHPTTLMKLTTRCGSAAVDGLNEALLAKAAEAKLLRTNRIRADTTVVPANVAYPTDSGLLAKAVRRIAATGQRIQAAGGATRTRVRDRSRAAGKRAHAIAREAADPHRRRHATRRRRRCDGAPVSWPSWPRPRPRRRAAAGQRASGRCAGPRPRPRELRGPRRHDAAAGRRRGRLVRAVNDLAELLDATRQIAAQTRQRLAGTTPDGADPAGQPARPRRPPDRQGPARANRSSSATRPRSSTTTTGSSSTTPSSRATRPTRPQLAPAVERVIKRTGRTPGTVTADRGYGEATRRRRPPRPRRADTW